MHQLILLRHAKAAAELPGGSDHDRPLTGGGRNAATAIGRAMRKSGLAPDVVLVSSAKRTQETFAALEAAAVWDEWPNVDTVPALYMATRQQLIDILRELSETVRSALVIGHNPGLHELALALTGAPSPRPELARLGAGYPTASLAEFLVTTPWRRLGPGATALQRFVQPEDVV
jgi:phosphohistidine phosphatase